MAEIKRKGEKGVAAKPKDMDINQNKTKTVKPSMNMRELAREKIRRQMEGQQVKGSKSKKVKDRKTPPKNLSLKSEKAKGKNYKSSLDRKVVEKDPESVLMKNYVKDARPGGRSGTAWLLKQRYRLGSQSNLRPDRIFNCVDEREEELERMANGQ